LNPDRPSVFAGAETILAHAASAHDQRISGQHGLFGGASESGVAPIRLPRDSRWSLAERMTAERDAFGFYFSAHPSTPSATCSPPTRSAASPICPNYRCPKGDRRRPWPD
jgi:DNA polymerase III alpha subunit